MSTDNTKQSTVAKGNAFRDHIAALLRSLGHDDVKTEQYIDGTAVDITFSKRELGRRVRYGVECKNYGSPLTKTYLDQKVYPGYSRLLDNDKFDCVLVVSQHEIGSDAGSWFSTTPRFVHFTEQRLTEELLGLDAYVKDWATSKAVREGQYIEARFKDLEGPAVDHVRNWIECDPGHGLAILAGYGRGKTSFANRLVREQAQRFRDNQTERMPVLIRLGQVVHEVELEGLFGKEFTSRVHAPGYSYRALELLNAAGRLLVVLDGFDEMKHAMTFSDFRANFIQLNRLLVGRAKVLLLGRPTAFTSESRELVLRGREVVNGTSVLSTKFAAWREVELASFSHDETVHLLKSCLEDAIARFSDQGRASYPPDFVATRSAEIISRLQSTDLLTRPVHITLVAELGANPDFSFENFDEYSLYQHFITNMIDRDVDNKQARRSIGTEPRRKFQRELAWWAWTRSGQLQGQFERDAIPPSLLADLPHGASQDDPGLLNEYIVSTLTEEKSAGILYFAHRSFQEFLVAERIITTRITPECHTENSEVVNPEILAFIKQGMPEGNWTAWCESLDACKGPLAPDYLALFLETHPARDDSYVLRQADFAQANYAALIFLATERHYSAGVPNDAFLAWMERALVFGTPTTSAMAILTGARFVGVPGSLWTHARFVGAILHRCLVRARNEDCVGGTLLINSNDADVAVDIVRENLKCKGDRYLSVCFSIDEIQARALRWIYGVARYLDYSRGWAVASLPGAKANAEEPKATVFQFIPAKLKERYYGFLFPNNSARFAIATRQERKPRSGYRPS